MYLAVGMACSMLFGIPQRVDATTLSDIQEELSEIQKEKDKLKQEQNGNKQQLAGAKSKINNLTGAMDTLDAEIEDLDAEIVGLLTDIGLIEQAIEDKKAEIQETQVKLEEAIETQNNQYEAMKIRIRYMYEKGDKSYVALLIESQSFEDALNKAEYIEKLYEYDRKLLLEYQETVKQVTELKAELEEEESELETSEIELKEQEKILSDTLAEKKQEYEDYDAMLVKAKQEAAVFTAKINQQTNELRSLESKEKQKKKEAEAKQKEEEEAKRKAEEAEKQATASGDSTSSNSNSGSKNNSSDPPKPSGGGGSKGQQIADYACQFIGNPYVAGGTSLTNGADCSGFTMSVYKQFGISIPRTSYAQSGIGTAVSYDQARAGDIIYYGGHVGIYLGDGRIVHASTERTGIKITSAMYRPIVTIRRIVN